ncbi:hypothetical protein BAU06_00650 [Bordetella bronchialis]|uniref:Poly-beta-1,6-N-acetyl-D-glucosamine biosynthesis protein PgaD n=2 Tax=Bordetella bronchialis TaxID=463025 RepID=A0ABM6CM37_9BORD|nr:hypothetical protein BAU06_00650 [Bordetella bronchialis]
MNPTSPERVRQDSRLIRQTLLKLSSPRLVARAIVIAIALVIWLLVAQRILAFGATLDYQFLHPLGASTIELLNRINPYLWWAVAAIWSLIVFFSVRAWLRGNMEAARLRPVPADTFADLAGELSDEVIAVMRWSWGSRDEPFTVGDLQRTLWEIRHGRIAKIGMVREQEALLGIPASVPGRMDRGERTERLDRRPGEPLAGGRDLPGERRRAVRAGIPADEPGLYRPGAAQPGAAQPGAARPGAARPGTGDPEDPPRHIEPRIGPIK